MMTKITYFGCLFAVIIVFCGIFSAEALIENEPKIIMIGTGYHDDFNNGYVIWKTNDPIAFNLSDMIENNGDVLIEYKWDFDGDGKFDYSSYTETQATYVYSKVKLYKARFQVNELTYEVFVSIGNDVEGYPPIPDFTIFSEPDPFENFFLQNQVFQVRLPQVRSIRTTPRRNPREPQISISDFNSPTFSPTMIPNVGIPDITFDDRNCTYVRPSAIDTRPQRHSREIRMNASQTINPLGKRISYFWDFGDGSYDYGAVVSHRYNEIGIYNVTLWIDDGKFSVFRTVTIQVRFFIRAYSPNIYLHPEAPIFDSVTLRFQGYAVVTIPEIEMGSEITWNNVWANGVTVAYNDETYKFLFYECDIVPITSNFGWILKRDDSGDIFLDGEKITYSELKSFFRNELLKAGLYNYEIDDLINEWLGNDEKLFFSQDTFEYAIRYIPQDILQEVMALETEVEYNSIIRTQFLIESADGGEYLTPPEYPKFEGQGSSLHEWGIIKGSNIP